MTTWWSLNYISTKYAVREIPPLLTSGLRMLIAGSIMLGLYWLQHRQGKIPHWDRRDVKRLVVIGIMGAGLNQFFFVLGISLTTVSHAAIMIGLTPITVLVLAWYMGLEKLSGLRLAGMLTALGGVAVLQFSSSKAGGATLIGDLIVYCGAVMFALYTVRGKRETARISGVVVNTFGYVGAAVLMLPITIGYSIGFNYARVTWFAWASLLYMAVFPSVICYAIYYYALSHVPASRVSAFSYLQPLLATLFAIPLLGEHPTNSLMMGGGLVLTGVFLAERG
jgi:drug/metabolite transporter (DMT)-like permease